jgi:hypothetical protein
MCIGTVGACNHVLAVHYIYKINYAYNKQYISPACVPVPVFPKDGTKEHEKKEVNPSKVKNLIFRPKSWPRLNIEERIWPQKT